MSTIFVRFRSLMSKINQHPALKEMFFIYDIYDAMLIFLLKIWACQDISHGLKNLKFLQTMIFTNLTLGGDYKILLGQDDILSGLVASRWCYYLFIKYILRLHVERKCHPGKARWIRLLYCWDEIFQCNCFSLPNWDEKVI